MFITHVILRLLYGLNPNPSANLNMMTHGAGGTEAGAGSLCT